ncbi:MAG: UvrD-helicase domain-containing protein [Panacagrimonas sp.]
MNAPLADAAQREAALDLAQHALVMAPAGSGKTNLLVHRILRALAVVDAPEQIVAITFTNKAAAEIRERVLKALRLAQGAAPVSAHEQALHASACAALARDAAMNWNLLMQPGRLNALTIDAFCAQIAAQLPLLSGLGGGIRVAEDARSLYLDAITRLFEELEEPGLPAADRAALTRVLRLYGNRLDRLITPLSSLLMNREQWLRAGFFVDDIQMVQQDAQALATLNASLAQDFESSLAAQDREELIAILHQGAAQSEMLAWAASLQTWPAAQSANLPQLRVLARLLLTADGDLRKSGGINKNSGFLPKQPYTLQFKAWLDAQQDNEALALAACAVRDAPAAELDSELRDLRAAWLRVLRRLAAHLLTRFAEAQQTDFGQLSLSALQALRDNAGYSDALLASDRRIRHLLVDEMQDTSEIQLQLLEALTREWTAGDGRSLFLVGDPQQSIYAFRKAEVRLFLQLWDTQRLGTLPLRRLSLSANFRSQPAVVDWFNHAFQTIFPARNDALRGAVMFAASEARVAAQDDAGVCVRACAGELAEAEAVATQAASLQQANPDGGVVVLARVRRHLEPVIRALRARNLTPVCQDIDPLAALPEVRDLLALARALWHPQDRLSWAVLLRAPFVGLSWAQLISLSKGRVRQTWPERIAHALEQRLLDPEGDARLRRLHTAIETVMAQRSLRAELADATEAVWQTLGGPACCSRAALDDVRQALRCLREETRGGGIRDLDRLQRRLAELYAAPRAGQIQMMTVHKAKGLEFDHVLLVGVNRKPRSEDAPPLHLFDISGVPLRVPKPDEAWDAEHPAHRVYRRLHGLMLAARRNEALRLLYVAITRARRSATLFVSVEADASGAVKFAPHSFAALLEPVIRVQVEAQIPAAEKAAPRKSQDLQAPRSPRLALEIELPQDAGLYRPAELRTLRPSEAVLSAQEEPESRRDEGDLYAQLVGTLFHEAMERIANEGLDAWADAGASRQHSMAAGLRRRGMPEPRVDEAVARVVELLRRTLASEQGRWLVSPKPWARSEYALAGLREGRWISAVIDRCFEDADGALWVIDYKTSAQTVPSAQIETYITQASEKYRAQITQYASLLAALRPDRPVRAALYFADADRLVEMRQDA